MKKWIIYIMLAVFATTTASAQPRQMRRGPQLTEEQRAEKKAEREAIQELAKAARNETDPVKKSELVEQLRAKVTERVEKMLAKFRKRLEQMNERLLEEESNKDQRIEQYVQDLLDGKKTKRPKWKGLGRKGSPSTVE